MPANRYGGGGGSGNGRYFNNNNRQDRNYQQNRRHPPNHQTPMPPPPVPPMMKNSPLPPKMPVPVPAVDMKKEKSPAKMKVPEPVPPPSLANETGHSSRNESNDSHQNASNRPTERKFTQRSRLFIGNLPTSITEEEFKNLFRPFGEVSETFVNAEKGFGFVRMDTRTNAERAKWELDGKVMRSNRQLRVRFATHGAALSVKNISPFVSNELLEEAFSQFGPVERAVVVVDDRGKSMERGIVEFARKSSATKALQQIRDGCFLLTSSPRAVVASTLEQEDTEDGLMERNVSKSQSYFQEREAPPRFAKPNSFEEEFARRWKALYDLERQQREHLEKNIQEAKEKLETEMENAIHDHQTMLMKQDLLRRQEELQRLEEARKRELDRRQELEVARENARKKEMEGQSQRLDMLRAQIEGTYKQDMPPHPSMGFNHQPGFGRPGSPLMPPQLHDQLAKELMGGQGGLAPAPLIKVKSYHHIHSDMNKLMDSLDKMSDSDQNFYRLAYEHCNNICTCKAQNYKIEDPMFERLEPCPKSFDCQSYSHWKHSIAMSWLNRFIDGFEWKFNKLKLQLLPIGPFPDFVENFRSKDGLNLFQMLVQFLSSFFSGSIVEMLPQLNIEDLNVRKRQHSFTGKEQYLVTDFLPFLKSHVPRDSFCVVALTWHDLYPSEDLNFVLGQASFYHYSCVASFGRFDPTYVRGFKGRNEGIDVKDMEDISVVDAALLWKLIKVVTHETCHVFGLAHCGTFSCLMNNSCSSEEALSQPLTLCPICMRKIQRACSKWGQDKFPFQVKTHLASLAQYLRTVMLPLMGSNDEMTNTRVHNTLQWIDRVLNFI
nr:uncharacterized protein LOC100184998 isoform X1 [Ciona intestinalis]|eukprot:XP_018667754.1 uncharacterized protein LOC100184998 isoform X1 [Ciona intestinalis]